MNNYDKTKQFHSVKVLLDNDNMIFESGYIAKQASGSILVRWGGTVVLNTVCFSMEEKDIDFLPLSCEYVEKFYAAGKIPSGFLKREAKPKDSEILIARLIDRSIRPLFPNDFYYDTQVISTVLSYDGKHDPIPMALSGVAMALHVSEIPFSLKEGPIAGVRICKIDDKFIVNPINLIGNSNSLDLIIAASSKSILMIEGGGCDILEEEILHAIEEGQKICSSIILANKEMQKKVGKEKIEYIAKERNSKIIEKINEIILNNKWDLILSNFNKIEKIKQFRIYKNEIIELISTQIEDKDIKKEIILCFEYIKKQYIRNYIYKNNIRIDGRNLDEIRPISSEVGILPNTHGSAIFTRGETQAIASVTLGTKDDEQKIDSLTCERWSRFMLHYNFPSFSVGEVKNARFLSRREIGHGALAEKSIQPVIPNIDQFPYTIRIVSETTESNGSSSMATVCSASLALMDAGVHIKSPVSGIAMGLMSINGKNIILSDILGDEDHIGDLDFKVCGTTNGITGIQMDTKLNGISIDLIKEILSKSKIGILYILKQMSKTISKSREQISIFAPKVLIMHINSNKIRNIIGPGGRTIKDISLKTSSKIEVSDDGKVNISSLSVEGINKAQSMIDKIINPIQIKIGDIYEGVVKKIIRSGVIIEILPGVDGFCHISEISYNRINEIKDVLSENMVIKVIVLEVNADNKIKLSYKKFNKN